MGGQESDRFVRSFQREDSIHRDTFIDIYNHRKDAFISDEIAAHADELTRETDM